MARPDDIVGKIDFIKQLFQRLTWAEMERIAMDLDEWRTADGNEGHTYTEQPITGDILSRWANESDIV